MLRGIDHLVVAVRDPEAAADGIERALGLAFTGGGRHATSGTFNRLAFLGDTYLELIGVFDRALIEASGSPVGRAAVALLDAGREGLATLALATDDVAADVTRLRAAGSALGDPVEGLRVRPDGELVRWVTAFPSGLGPDRPPFLIEHETVGAEWGHAARSARARFAHPAGGPARLTAVTLPAGDPGAVADAWRETLDVAFDADRAAVVGDQAIRLSPGRAGRDPAVVDLAIAGAGPAATRVAVLAGVRWRLAATAVAIR